MKTIEALNVLNVLNAITKPVPVKFAYASSINRKRLAEVAEAFEEARKGLLDKHGQRDEAGKLVEKDGKVQMTDFAAFSAEFTALSDGDTEVNLHKVALTDFPAEIEGVLMDWLLPMVQEDAA